MKNLEVETRTSTVGRREFLKMGAGGGALAMAALGAPAAFAETVPVRLDDNITVPATAGGVLWVACLMDAAAVSAARNAVVAAAPWALGVNVLAAWLGYRAHTVSRSGAVAGAVVGTIIYVGGGASAWALLVATFLAASVTSRFGLKRKVLLGIAEERGGRRGAGNAIANCGVAAVAAIAAIATRHTAASLLALVAALTAGGSRLLSGGSAKITDGERNVSRGPPGRGACGCDCILPL